MDNISNAKWMVRRVRSIPDKGWRVSPEESVEMFKIGFGVENSDSTIIITDTGKSDEYSNIRKALPNCTYIIVKNMSDVKESAADLAYAGVCPKKVLYSNECKDFLKDIEERFPGCRATQIPTIFRECSEEYLGYYWEAVSLESPLKECVLFDLVKIDPNVLKTLSTSMGELVDNGNRGRLTQIVILEFNKVLMESGLMHLVNEYLKEPSSIDSGEIKRIIEGGLDRLWKTEL